ncbi:MAG: class I SAM-dependent methyltransferase [Alphaproteobacteria bacterium]|jgi:SAM-dependent methyltransferase|nr:class I SAM-dependent methyltransferase [Alphaproteobacteria bacterium]MDP6815578.1 class I SAM-dependent methyltransferase [Alphaproteobacteria bacterium]
MIPTEPSEDRLYQAAELAQFYDFDNPSNPGHDYCRQLAKDARSVLDLGCGTGRLAADLAAERSVVGVDPASAMLDVARQRPGGDRVTWVEADARTVRLGRQFDLVLLTGHAFQVFITEEDQRSVCATIAEHLTAGGQFIFDSRNPAAEAWRGWTPDRSRRCFEHPWPGTIEAWNDVGHDAATDIVTYQTHYRVVGTDRCFSASSKIRFTSRDLVAALLADVGLKVDRWLGDWDGGACKTASPEIIPIGRLA